jgi:transcriptional regulator with XRE-family HTH domain
VETSGQILRRAREAAGLTQEQLAVRAGTGQAAISQIERGQLEPPLLRLRSLVALTGHELDAAARPLALSIDEALFLHSLRMLPEERLELTVELSRSGLALRAAGRHAEVDRAEREIREQRELAGL